MAPYKHEGIAARELDDLPPKLLDIWIGYLDTFG